MTDKEFGIEDLRRILRAGAGVSESVDIDGNIADVDFEDLGYESLALLETFARIEREFGAVLDEDTLAEARTPRALIDTVNAHLGANSRI